MIKDISFKGVIVGSITVFSTSILLLIVMPLVFLDLIKTGKMDVLITSFGPRLYTLGVVFISGLFGIYIGSIVANSANWINSTLIILISLLLTYIVNKPASEFGEIYPAWFTISSYVLCGVSLFAGHYISKFLITRSSSKDAVNGAA